MIDVDQIIEEQCYKGIRDQDGWETLELTVNANHSPVIARLILDKLAVA